MHVIDSHTGGEPTRVILDGGPDLGAGPLAGCASLLASEHRDFTRSVSHEPRGQVAMICALLVAPVDPGCVTGVIFFDAEAVLGMCGHGTIGLAATLAHMGRIGPGSHRIETPVGVVTVDVADANTVTNIESRRTHPGVTVEIGSIGAVSGDVAYGGNLFFLVDPSPFPVVSTNIQQLMDVTIAVREAVKAKGIEVDHVIFYGPPAPQRRIVATSCSAPTTPMTAHPAAPDLRRGWPKAKRSSSKA